MTPKKPTKTEYERFLNELGVPQEDRRSNGGRINDYAAYGIWMRTNDPIAFEVGFNEWVREVFYG